MTGRRPSPPARLLLALLRAYQRFLSPLMAPSCRFWPSCSAYAGQAIREHGAVRGGVLAMRRLLRCHPLSRGGVDPVPPARQKIPGAPRSSGAPRCSS